MLVQHLLRSEPGELRKQMLAFFERKQGEDLHVSYKGNRSVAALVQSLGICGTGAAAALEGMEELPRLVRARGAHVEGFIVEQVGVMAGKSLDRALYFICDYVRGFNEKLGRCDLRPSMRRTRRG